MDFPVVLFLGAAIIALACTQFIQNRKIIKLQKGMSIIAPMVREIAINHNSFIYKVAKYIVGDMTEKAKSRELTTEEQEYFHFCRELIHEFETKSKGIYE